MSASKTLTPEQRRENKRKAGKARHSTDVYIRQLVDRAAELTPEQRDKLAGLLRPTGSGAVQT